MVEKLDSVIAELVNQIKDKEFWYEKARRDNSEQRMETCRTQSVALKYALGLALVVRTDGRAPQEYEALLAANVYLAS